MNMLDVLLCELGCLGVILRIAIYLALPILALVALLKFIFFM